MLLKLLLLLLILVELLVLALLELAVLFQEELVLFMREIAPLLLLRLLCLLFSKASTFARRRQRRRPGVAELLRPCLLAPVEAGAGERRGR